MGKKLNVLGKEVTLHSQKSEDYISLTDIARYKDQNRSDYIIQNWLRSRTTLEFLGLWEQIHNPNFNSIEFDGFRKLSGLNNFILTPKQWIERTYAIGILSKSGRYGGTYAHKDIAFEFASWISVEFKLYLIKEFQRLKAEESDLKHLDWDIKRNLSKINYRIHTDAIKRHLVPPKISKTVENIIYASGNMADAMGSYYAIYQDIKRKKKVLTKVLYDNSFRRRSDVTKLTYGQIKFYPLSYFPTDTWIYKNKVLIVTYTAKPPIAILIVSQETANSYKKIFEGFWKKAKY